MKHDDQFLYTYRKEPPQSAVDSLWNKMSVRESAGPFWAGTRPLGVTACLLFVVLSFAVVPPMRALAQEAWQFFAQTAQDSFAIVATLGEPDAAPVIEYERIGAPDNEDVDVLITDGASVVQPEFIYTTLEAAQAQTDVPIQAPAQLPDGYALLGAIVRTNSPLITLLYGIDGEPLLTLHHVDHPESAPGASVATTIHIGEALDNTFETTMTADVAFGEISQLASVESVQVGEMPGEYVRGVWRIDPAVVEGAAAGEAISLVPEWDMSAGGQMLRWQRDATHFELIATDEALSQEMLLQIAGSIQ